MIEIIDFYLQYRVEMQQKKALWLAVTAWPYIMLTTWTIVIAIIIEVDTVATRFRYSTNSLVIIKIIYILLVTKIKHNLRKHNYIEQL